MNNIEDVNVMILSFPTSHYISGWRLVRCTYHLIIFLFLDNGVIGIGEGTPYSTTIYDDYRKVLKLSKIIMGLNIQEALNVLKDFESRDFNKNARINYGSNLALESAILNALSKIKDVKEASILGGLYIDKVPISGTIFLTHPKKMGKELKKLVEKGIKHVKFKIPCSLRELERIVKSLDDVRRNLGKDDLVFRADANECFKDFEKADKAFTIMEKYRVKIIEQPMPRDRLKDLAKLRKKYYPVIEIMLDESLRRPSDIKVFAQMEVADAINFHPSKLGCLTTTRKAILETQKMGMKANIGSALMTEIGLSHYLNLAASIPRLDYPLEEVGLFNLYGYSITRNTHPIFEGSIPLYGVDILDLDFSLMKNFTFKEKAFTKKFIKNIVIKVLSTLKRQKAAKVLVV